MVYMVYFCTIFLYVERSMFKLLIYLYVTWCVGLGLMFFMINETLLGFCIFYIVSDHGSGCYLEVNLLSTDCFLFIMLSCWCCHGSGLERERDGS